MAVSTAGATGLADAILRSAITGRSTAARTCGRFWYQKGFSRTAQTPTILLETDYGPLKEQEETISNITIAGGSQRLCVKGGPGSPE